MVDMLRHIYNIRYKASHGAYVNIHIETIKHMIV